MTTYFINSILPDLQRASFKGVQFLFQSGEQTGGRKLYTAEYPQRDTRTAVDLGKYPDDFSITAILDNAIDYINSRKRLVTALESKGKGLLVHPYLGSLTVVVDRYTINETTSRLGYCSVAISFKTVSSDFYPTTSNIIDAAQIFAITSKIIDQMRTEFLNVYFLLNSFNIGIFNNASSDLSNQLFAAFSIVQSQADKVTNITNSFTAIADTSASLDSTTYYNNLNSAYSTAYDGLNTASSQSAFNEANFGFTTDNLINSSSPNVTASRVAQNTNIALINFTFNLLAFIYNLNATSQLTFDTLDEIVAKKEKIAKQFEFLRDNNFYYPDNTGIILPLVSNDLLDLAQQAKSLTYKYLANLQSTVNKIQEITVQRESLLSLVYKLYGNIDNLQAIIDLNKIQDPSNITGTIRVISQ